MRHVIGGLAFFAFACLVDAQDEWPASERLLDECQTPFAQLVH